MKPLWAVAGVALLGTAGVAGAIVVASPGGEEEVVQEVETNAASAPTPTGTCIAVGDGSGEVRCLSAEQLAAPCPPGVQCGPPTPPWSCVYVVVDGDAPCLPLDDPRVADWEQCSPIRYGDRAACLPAGARHFSVYEGGGYAGIERGHSIIKWEDVVFEYYVAPEDEADFQALRELFLPGGATPPPAPYPYSCRYIVIDAEVACLPMDNPAVRACTPIDFQERSACPPAGSQFSADTAQSVDPVSGETLYRGYSIITRGNTRIKYNLYDEAPVEYFIAPEEEADFRALEVLFKGGR